ncbi:hypothetical protein [Streptomyces sp. GC420]|uniref:hypothetical protein n=1 Tax=Streptomyces sp. GC420 TaxID=2697568 RepID=UPI001414EE01|nr:hypothetical protein [Streptomyces sp. GC420]NBM15908.1 hypothetical protein [Streptomyces sp. GC420]
MSTTPPEHAEITRGICGGCSAMVEGLNGRYSCALCGWVNRWDQSPAPLPSKEDDPDYDKPQPRPKL